MENIGAVLSNLLILHRKGRVSYQMLRRFVECPERVLPGWSTRLASDQMSDLVEGSSTVVHTRLAERALEMWTRAQDTSVERYHLIMARKAYAMGAKHGFNLLLTRTCATHCPSTCTQHDPRVSEAVRDVYREISSHITGWLRGERLSPFEAAIRFVDTGERLMNHVAAAADPALIPAYQNRSDNRYEKTANLYWCQYLDRAYRKVGR